MQEPEGENDQDNTYDKDIIERELNNSNRKENVMAACQPSKGVFA